MDIKRLLINYLKNIFGFKSIRRRSTVLILSLFVFIGGLISYYKILSYSRDANLLMHQNLFVTNDNLKKHIVKKDAGELKEIQSKLADIGIPYVNINPNQKMVPKQRLVHLDLKGAPPTVEYLKRLFPLIKILNGTGVIIEYEDMFPYSGPLSDISAHNAYSARDILKIISLAKDSGLKIIPLLQTFGHLEFALKRPRFLSLREVPHSPQVLCPSNNDSLVFLEVMLTQVMDLHKNFVDYIHIGCDEVYHLAHCKKCSEGGEADMSRRRDELYLKHVRNVARIIQRRWPNLKILIWDDMLRHIPSDLMLKYEIGKYVEPVVWVYVEDIQRFVPNMVWDKYAAIFDSAWSASAYKGAYGETLVVPDVRRHLENNLQWLNTMAHQEKKFKKGFSGIMLTGWQRYDHFAVLCELLPASVPSLSLMLLTTSHGGFEEVIFDKFAATLGCPMPMNPLRANTPKFTINLNSDPNMWDKLRGCLFPGSEFFRLTYEYHLADSQATEFLYGINRVRGWLTPYNIRRNYTSAERVIELVGGSTIGGIGEGARILQSLKQVVLAATESLRNITDAFSIAEWIEQRLYTQILDIEKVLLDARDVSHKRTWERRPLPALADLQRFGVILPELPDTQTNT